MKKSVFTFTLFIISIFVSGCGQKQINLTAVKPAYVSEALKYDTIAVLPIKNDHHGLTSLLEEKLMNKKFDGKNIFHVASRSEMKDILNEQAFNNSDAVKEGDKLNLGQIEGVDALIVGNVNNEFIRDSYFYKTRTECRDKDCNARVKVRVNCTQREFNSNLTLKMIDVESSKVVVSKTYFDKRVRRLCEDDYYSFMDSTAVMMELEDNMLNRFVSLISPTKYNVKATIVEEEPEYDLTGKQEDMIEEAISALENKFYDKSKKIFKQVLQETNQKSYVATYNLALIAEIERKYDEALSLYERCKYIVKDLSKVPELNQSILRVKSEKRNIEIAKEQVLK